MSKNKFNKSWMKNHLGDPFVKQAQKDGYRARAVYKLSEIDEDAQLVRPGQVIVDLGCAPGSWSQYLARKLGTGDGQTLNGTVIGLDMLPMEPVPGIHFIQGDFREESVLRELETLLDGKNDILKRFRETFETVTPKKPKASRDYSSEVFLLGRKLRQ